MKSLILSLLLIPSLSTASSLPKLNLEREVTLSGLSSGAFFAIQFHLAHSSWVKGVGSVAGGIFGCAEGDVQRGLRPCMSEPQKIKPAIYIKTAKELAAAGKIDSLDNLQSSKVFLFQSRGDSAVHFPSVEKLIEFYHAFLPQNSIKLMTHEKAAHGFPVKQKGNECDAVGLPYLQNCDVDGAEEILKNLLGNLNPAVAPHQESLISFSQEEFGTSESQLHKEGFIYVPVSCQAGQKCKLHIAFHGCRQNQDFVEGRFREDAGYNAWAESNNLVVLYPSADKSKNNPFACWDWLGFTGPDYLNKDGPQMIAIRHMVNALSGVTR